jgi:hypothetical protein
MELQQVRGNKHDIGRADYAALIVAPPGRLRDSLEPLVRGEVCFAFGIVGGLPVDGCYPVHRSPSHGSLCAGVGRRVRAQRR